MFELLDFPINYLKKSICSNVGTTLTDRFIFEHNKCDI